MIIRRWKSINHTLLHRWLKWVWVALLPVSFWWRESVIWVVIMSHYAILVSHWAAEEAAPDEDEDEHET